MSKEDMRIIPKKNYVILGFVLLASFFLVYYLYLWYVAYEENILTKPILNKYMEMINYNELEDYFIENPDTIIYVSVLEDKEIRDFEKEFKKVFKKHYLDNEMLYLNITEEVKDEDIKKDILSKYSVNSQSILDVPSIMVVEDGKLKSIYNIVLDDYDIDKIKLFVNGIKFNEEDELSD